MVLGGATQSVSTIIATIIALFEEIVRVFGIVSNFWGSWWFEMMTAFCRSELLIFFGPLFCWM